MSKHLFDECMLGYLRGKTRILATHQLQFLTGADRIILVEHGKMIMFDNHQDLFAARPEYGHLVAIEKTSAVNESASNERELVRLRSYSSRSSRVSIFNCTKKPFDKKIKKFFILRVEVTTMKRRVTTKIIQTSIQKCQTMNYSRKRQEAILRAPYSENTFKLVQV